MLKIVALLAVHNAAKTIGVVLENWRKNQIDVHVIDHGSTDETADILELYKDAPVVDVSRLKFEGVYHWKQLLRLKEDVVRTLDADWVLHADADEIFESSVPGESIRAMIDRLDREGSDIIDCDEFVFVPDASDQVPENFVEVLKTYYHFAPPGRALHRAQRMENVSLKWSETGGHRLELEGRKLASEKIRLRHYIGLSFNHLKSQYLGRVFDGDELSNGWHHNRVPTTLDFIVKPNPSQLFDIETHGWRTDSPQATHLLFNQTKPYYVPQRIAPNDILPAFPNVVGVGRSGTTLLRMLLDAHPKICISPEAHWLLGAMKQLTSDPKNIGALRSIITKQPSWVDMGVSAEQLEEILFSQNPEKPADTIRKIYKHYAQRQGKQYVGDKTPLHNLSMCEIARMLPETRFIHIIRDGRDVALSYRDLWFGPGKDMATAATFWMWCIRETRQQAEFLPHYIEIRYEELLTDTEKVLRRIAEFIGIPFHPLQLLAHERAEVRRLELNDIVRDNSIISAEQHSEIHQLTKSPPDASRIGAWRREMSNEDLQIFESVAGNMLTDLGYARGEL